MGSRGRVRVRAAFAGVMSAGLLATAGCAQAQPDAVAYVGATRITQSQLDSAQRGVKAALPDQIIPVQAVINVLIAGEIADQIAAQHHVVLSDPPRDSIIKSTELAPLLNVPEAKPVAYDVADQQLTAKQLGAPKYLAALKGTRVTLNPRYGVLDPNQKIIVTDQSSSLSVPAPGATPTPVP